MRREVVENQINPFFDRIARAHPFESTKDILPAFAPTEVSPELTLSDVQECEPLLRAVGSGIGGRQAIGVRLACPRPTCDGAELNGTHLIIA